MLTRRNFQAPSPSGGAFLTLFNIWAIAYVWGVVYFYIIQNTQQ